MLSSIRGLGITSLPHRVLNGNQTPGPERWKRAQKKQSSFGYRAQLAWESMRTLTLSTLRRRLRVSHLKLRLTVILLTRRKPSSKSNMGNSLGAGGASPRGAQNCCSIIAQSTAIRIKAIVALQKCGAA